MYNKSVNKGSSNSISEYNGRQTIPQIYITYVRERGEAENNIKQVLKPYERSHDVPIYFVSCERG